MLNNKKNLFNSQKKIINTIDYKDYNLRYCASEKSIPKEAIDINLIYGRISEFSNQELINPNTMLPFGFSYKINKKIDITPKRIIEFDIKNDYYNDIYDKMKSYSSFTNYYNDEEFELYEDIMEKELNNNSNNKPEFKHSNIILDGYDTDDSGKIIRNYNKKNLPKFK